MATILNFKKLNPNKGRTIKRIGIRTKKFKAIALIVLSILICACDSLLRFSGAFNKQPFACYANM